MKEKPEDNLRGQMTIDEWLKVPEAKIDFDKPDPGARIYVYETPAAETKGAAEAAGSILYGERSCEACVWITKDKTCKWAEYERRHNMPASGYTYPSCGGFGSFEPSDHKVPQMCANCKWSNCFHYETKPEYVEYTKRTGRQHKEAFRDPVEEPNIYCTHPEGSLNRRTAYKDIEWPGFGACHWDRQHEWDTCDRWEIDRGDYIDYTKYFPQYKKRH